MAAEESLVFKVLGQDGATVVFKRVEKSVSDLRSTYQGLVGAAAALGVGAFIKDAIDWQESLARLGEIAGTLPSKLSGFALPAKLAGTSLETVASSMAKLSRSIGEARLGDVGKASIFQALGIDPNDGRDAADVMVDVAKALAGMTDQNVAAKVASELLGKSFAELRPLMEEIKKQGKLDPFVTEEQVKRAKEFHDNMVRLEFATKKTAIALTENLVVALGKATDAMVRAQNEGKLDILIAGFRTLFTGDDEHKANVEFSELLDQKLGIENELMKLKFLGKQDTAYYRELVDTLKQVNEQLERTRNYRRDLAAQSAAAAAAAHGETGGGEGSGAGKGGKKKTSEAERLIRERMAFEKEYPALIQAQETGARNYATSIRVADAYLAETRKLGLITEEEFIEQRAKNEDMRLEMENKFLEEEIRLARQKGDVERRGQAERRIAQNNAAREANKAIADAQISSAQEQKARSSREAGGKAFADTDRFIDELAYKRDAEERWYQDRLNALAAFESLGGEEAEKAAKARERLASEHRDRLVAIAQDEWEHRVLFAQFTNRDLMSTNQYLFGTLAELMQSHSQRMFKVGKAAAIANTIISTYEAAQKAYGALAGIPIVGPALGAAAAAAAILVGLQRVQAIRATAFGGGGSASPVYNASPGTSIPSAPIGGAAAAPVSAGPTFHIHLEGPLVGSMTDLARALGDELRDLIGDQDFTIIDANSRQAAVITSGA